MTTNESTTLLADARKMLPELVELRRRIHRHPELGLILPKTQATVLDAIDGLGLAVRTGTSVSSVVADLEVSDGPVVLFRGDMDALPMPEDTGLDFASEVSGCMHACGHDAHTAMLVGATRLLHARRGELAGTVRFMFQPGEEGHHGAQFMIDEGVLDGDEPVDAAFALHVSPNLPAGTIWTRGGPLMASADVLAIKITGRGGHASTPYLANDPMPIAAEIVQALQVMVTRRINTFDPVVVTITKIRAGTTDNVIPETVDMLGTLRAVSEASRALALESMDQLVARHRERARHGCRVDGASGLPGHDQPRRERPLRRAGRGPSARPRQDRQHAGPGHGRGGLLLRAATTAGRDVVPRGMPPG